MTLYQNLRDNCDACGPLTWFPWGEEWMACHAVCDYDTVVRLRAQMRPWLHGLLRSTRNESATD